MSDLKTYEGFKNWLLGGALAVCSTLLGLMAADNRRLIIDTQTRVAIVEKYCVSLDVRLTRTETDLSSQRADISRRLERIEQKMDRWRDRER